MVDLACDTIPTGVMLGNSIPPNAAPTSVRIFAARCASVCFRCGPPGDHRSRTTTRFVLAPRTALQRFNTHSAGRACKRAVIMENKGAELGGIAG